MIVIDSSAVALFGAALKGVPAAVRLEATQTLFEGANRIVADARSNAAWSTRIPDAISARMRMFGEGPSGVEIRVDEDAAPHARAYEGLGTAAPTFRHPVFGTSTWVTQSRRPFIQPAVEQHEDSILREVDEAVDRRLDSVGAVTSAASFVDRQLDLFR